MPEQLKRCPFCGSKVTAMSALPLPFMMFKCDNWHGCGATISFDNDEANRDKSKAIKYFNRRVK